MPLGPQRRKHKGWGAEKEGTLAGEEAARLWVQKFWPAVVPSHLLVCCFPCWVTKGMAPTTSVPDRALPILSTKVSLFLRSTSKDKAGASRGSWMYLWDPE